MRISKIPASGPQINYFLSGSDVWCEQPAGSGGTPTVSYILAGSMSGPLGLFVQGAPTPYHYTLGDGQGSVMGLTDAAGTITDQYQYDAWGNPVALLNPPPTNTYNPYRYTGQQSDSSTNLYYLRNRYYDAQAGRFITQDPIGFRGGLNFYAYVKNNPANFVDPEGEGPMVNSVAGGVADRSSKACPKKIGKAAPPASAASKVTTLGSGVNPGFEQPGIYAAPKPVQNWDEHGNIFYTINGTPQPTPTSTIYYPGFPIPRDQRQDTRYVTPTPSNN